MPTTNGNGPAPAGQAQLVFLAASELVPWPHLNPRRRFDEARLAELETSIRKQGVLEPILVHERSADDTFQLPRMPAKQKYLIVAGERRWRAASQVGDDVMVPCMVRRFAHDEAIEIALVENLERADLSAIEEAIGLAELLKLPGITQGVLAQRLGRSQPFISNRVRLLELPVQVLTLIEEGSLDVSAARDVLLPFAKIPEAKRTKLYAEFVKAWRADLEEAATNEWDEEGDPKQIISEIASKMSLPVDANAAAYNEQKPLFDPKEHAACTCGGPSFTYGWQGASVRCFDEEWWTTAQEAAHQRAKDTTAKAAARAEKAGASAAAATTMKESTFQATYGDTWALQVDNHLLDASAMADATLVVVERNHGPAVVCCTDAKVLKRAKSVVTREQNALLKEKKAERGAVLRAEAEKAKLEPWMLAQILKSRPYRDSMLDVAREIGLDANGANRDQLDDLSSSDVELLFKGLAIRYKGAGEYLQDKLPQEVSETIRKRYAPGVAALVRKAKAAADGQPPKPKRAKKAAVPA